MISSKKEILAHKFRLCKSVFCQGIGLMFSFRIDDFGLIFEFKKARKMSLHMFFVFYPIDVLFLDAEQRVVDMKKNFKPFCFYKSKQKAKFVIELPKGSIKKTKLNDKIVF